MITSFKIKNKPVPIGARSVLKRGIPYVDSLTLSYLDNVFSFEFAALSYANSHKNRYRYKLEGFDTGWNEVGSNQRQATYTNLDPAHYVFHVQGSNSDGVWNEKGVSLPILITPPIWKTNWFRALCAAVLLAMLWVAYRFRVRQLQHEFNMRLGERLDERGRIARELHDTLLQSFQGLMFSFQAARNLLPGRTEEAIRTLDGAIREGDEAIAEGRDAIQGLRANPGRRDIWSICSQPRERNSRDLPVRRANFRHFRSLWKERGNPCRRSFRTRSTGLRARSCETPFTTRAPAASRLKSRTTDNSSGCGFATMAGVSTPRSWRQARARGTGDCRASASAQNESGRG